MLKAKHLKKISKLYDGDNESVLNKIEKMIIQAASNGKYELEFDTKFIFYSILLDADIREKLTRKGFTLFYGKTTTCISWENI